MFTINYLFAPVKATQYVIFFLIYYYSVCYIILNNIFFMFSVI